jgi:hypothetical protein
MARYTSLFTVASSVEQLRDLLKNILESCSLDIIYDTGDYLVAREKPGQVSFAQLVTVEVLLDQSLSSQETRMNFVVKNEELPLKVDNHCHRIFDNLNQAIVGNHQWHLIESVA